MHGLMGGKLETEPQSATATEKNTPRGNLRDTNGSVPYRRPRSPRQLPTLCTHRRQLRRRLGLL
jgi:hypothetical protein